MNHLQWLKHENAGHEGGKTIGADVEATSKTPEAQAGLTLIELIAVVVVLGVLIAMLGSGCILGRARELARQVASVLSHAKPQRAQSW